MNVKRPLIILATATALSACALARDDYALGDYVSDTQIATTIKSKYAADRVVPLTAVNVDSLEGVVQLSGFVQTQEAKERAALLARQTKGVKTVRNNIIVR